DSRRRTDGGSQSVVERVSRKPSRPQISTGFTRRRGKMEAGTKGQCGGGKEVSRPEQTVLSRRNGRRLFDRNPYCHQRGCDTAFPLRRQYQANSVDVHIGI